MSTDISSPNFTQTMETRLAQTYLDAYARKAQIEAGQFTGLKRRRRKKRYVVVGDIGVDVSVIRVLS